MKPGRILFRPLENNMIEKLCLDKWKPPNCKKNTNLWLIMP